MTGFFKPLSNFLLVALLFSCTEGTSEQAGNDFPMPKPGIIHKKIVCSGDPGRSYALYLPEACNPMPDGHPDKGISGMRLHPVIIAFDPHGDGVLPISLYKTLAEKYGFIMAGSNDSKNGLPADEIKGIVTLLIHEVSSHYPVDTNRVYLLGFSGGARVAAMTAMYLVPVNGVIGCGAGLGGSEQPVLHKFDYFGMAGTADFNMNELLELDVPLTQAGIRHFITTFPGIHAWPPAGPMEDAFQWFCLNAMKDGITQKDPGMLSQVHQMFASRMHESSERNDFIALAHDYREAISFLDGLTPVDTFRNALALLKHQARYQAQVANQLRVRKEEEAGRQEMMDAFQANDLEWWENKIKQYDPRSTALDYNAGKITAEDTLKNRRVLSFLSLFCYMNANAAIAQQNETAGIKIVAIYEMADPSNPEPNYMRAVLLARRSEDRAAIAQLNIAVSKGFADTNRLVRQPEFESMHNSIGWTDLQKTLNK